MPALSIIVPAALAAFSGVVGTVYLRSIGGGKSVKSAVSSSPQSYPQRGDTTQQAIYDAQKKAKIPAVSNDVDESWKFLYDVTEFVTTQFPEADKDTTVSSGKVILGHGGNYEHVVKYGIRHHRAATAVETSKTDPVKSV